MVTGGPHGHKLEDKIGMTYRGTGPYGHRWEDQLEGM